MSELRASACDGEHAAVRQAPDARRVSDRRRARDCRYLAPATTSWYSALPAAAGVRRVAERPAVADAAAVVDRHDDVALAGEPLVDAVRPVVELHVVVAEQHLARGPAVHEDDRGTLLAGLDVLRQEELVVDLEAVGGLRQDELRLDVRVGREALARRREHDLLRRPRPAIPGCPSVQTPSDCGIFQSALSVASALPDASGVGTRLDAAPGRHLHGRAAGDRHGPDVAALDVLRVGAVVERLAVGATAPPTSGPRSARRSSSAARACAFGVARFSE